ncbi:MAG: chorismate--pyruvate lyase family protein [Janthinobacterium lividum]
MCAAPTRCSPSNCEAKLGLVDLNAPHDRGAGQHHAEQARAGGWRARPSAVWSPAQQDWLTRGGSLTLHLQALGAVQIEVLSEGATAARGSDAHCLRARIGAPIWLREVVLRVDGRACVAAHSVTPLHASRGAWRAMRGLHTRPLGSLLYHDRSVTRSALVSRRVMGGDPLYALAGRASVQNTADPAGTRNLAQLERALPARRSVFMRRGQPLLVVECLLPSLWSLLSGVD